MPKTVTLNKQFCALEQSGHLNVGLPKIAFGTQSINANYLDLNCGVGDIVKIALPAYKLHIVSFSTTVETVEGAACTINVGYTGSATAFHNGLDINAAATTVSAAGVFATPVVIDNTAGDVFLTVLCNSAATDTAVVRFNVVYFVIN